MLKLLLSKEDKETSVYEYKTAKGKRYYVKCGNHTKRGFTSKREAKKAEKELKKLALIEEIQEEQEDRSLYFSNVAKEYLENISSLSEVKIGTIRKRHNMVEKVILPNVKDKPINKFTKKDCMAFRLKIKNTEYSTSQKNQILQTFKQIFKYAKRYLDVDNDPSFVIDPFKKTFEDKMKKKEKDDYMWTSDDFDKFIACVDGMQYKAFFTILFYTGMRLGEIQALRWKDFDGHSLHIYKALSKESGTGHLHLSTPKTVNSVRDVELGSDLSRYLSNYKERKMQCAGFNEDWYIFGDTKYLSRTTLTRKKDQAVEKAGVSRMTLHEFRHAHASNLIANGANIVSVSRRLGHSSVTITLDNYTHLMNKNDQDLINKLGFSK